MTPIVARRSQAAIKAKSSAAQVSLEAPVGVLNVGLDCYAQVLRWSGGLMIIWPLSQE